MPELTGMSIIVFGDPATGFSFVGPFKTRADAHDAAERYLSLDVWWIAPLLHETMLTELAE